MRIEPFSVALDPPLETARGPIDRRNGYLVSVEHAGQVGYGEATPLPGWTESRQACRQALNRAEAVAGELDWGVAIRRMEAPAARHGLALALADARAKAAETPLYRTLDAEQTVRQVPVNATVGDGDPDETAAAAKRAIDAGFECLKVKIGARSLDADRRRLVAIRDAVGGDVILRADANGAWDRDQAEIALDWLADLDVVYVEQPLPADDLEGCARLRGGPVGIAADEALVENDVERILELGSADVAVLKPMVLGGPDRAAEVATQYLEAGVDPIVSTTFDAVVARTAAVHVAATIPAVGHCGLATADRLRSDLGRDPVPVEAGSVFVPQGNGLGLPARPKT
jgi:o-succinylbenzoate synthase